MIDRIRTHEVDVEESHLINKLVPRFGTDDWLISQHCTKVEHTVSKTRLYWPTSHDIKERHVT